MGSLILAAVAMVFGWSLLAMSLVADDAAIANVTADVAATQFIAYHQAVSAYVVTHPGFSGVVPSSALTFPPGYVVNSSWANQVVNGVGYTYPHNGYKAPPGFIDVLNTVGGSVCIRSAIGDRADCGWGAWGGTPRDLPNTVASAVLVGNAVITTR